MSLVPLSFSTGVSLWVIEHLDLKVNLDLMQWFLLFVGITVLMSLAITPTTFSAIVLGFYLKWEAVIPFVVSYSVASYIGYALSKALKGELIEGLIKSYPKSNEILDKADKNAYVLVILSRLSPALPFAIMNLVLGVMSVRQLPFLLGGMIGMLPRSLFAIWIGSNALNIATAVSEKPGIWILLLVTFVVFGAIYFLLRPSSNRQ